MKSITTLFLFLALSTSLSAQYLDGRLLVLNKEEPIALYANVTQKLAFQPIDRRDPCAQFTDQVRWSSEDALLRQDKDYTWEIHPTQPEGEVTIYLEVTDDTWTELGKFTFRTIAPDYDDPDFQSIYPKEHLAQPLTTTDSFTPTDLTPNKHYDMIPYTSAVHVLKAGQTQAMKVMYMDACQPLPDLTLKVDRKKVSMTDDKGGFELEVPTGKDELEVEFWGRFDKKPQLITTVTFPVEAFEPTGMDSRKN